MLYTMASCSDSHEGSTTQPVSFQASLHLPFADCRLRSSDSLRALQSSRFQSARDHRVRSHHSDIVPNSTIKFEEACHLPMRKGVSRKGVVFGENHIVLT